MAEVTVSKAEFYNNIYRARPSKWASLDRDLFAFHALRLSGVDAPDSVLDIGCGNGHTLAFFKSQWPDAAYTGVDISDVALEIAGRRMPEAEFFQEMPALGLWDVITLMGVAEHFEDPASELSMLGTRLSGDGCIYLECPNCLAYSDSKEEGFRQTHKGADQEEWHWTRETWEGAIEKAGLGIAKRFKGLSPAWEFIWVLRC